MNKDRKLTKEELEVHREWQRKELENVDFSIDHGDETEEINRLIQEFMDEGNSEKEAKELVEMLKEYRSIDESRDTIVAVKMPSLTVYKKWFKEGNLNYLS